MFREEMGLVDVGGPEGEGRDEHVTEEEVDETAATQRGDDVRPGGRGTYRKVELRTG